MNNKYIEYLRRYDGRELSLMEVCGSHTAAIAKSGLKSILSPKIKLISGPGCPVCVTPSSYIDRLIELSLTPGCCVVTFGDLLRVPGSSSSLNLAKGTGANVRMVYSPMDTLTLAQKHPNIQYIFAAVGFETTTPVYALLLEQIEKREIKNIKLLTALKTMPAAIDSLMDRGSAMDGFLAPGHVCAVTGYKIFEPLAKKYGIPFAVGGFENEQLITAICGLVRMAVRKEAAVRNFYPTVVTPYGNRTAQEKIDRYFMPCDAVWRGMGVIKNSGRLLREEYRYYDAGSLELTQDIKLNNACRCGDVLTGHLQPQDCPLFNGKCTPQHPQGACMVSYEGSCYQNYLNHA